MADNRSPALRSKTMAAVGQRDTGPEMVVRRLLHNLGYRYRLHRKDLPGRPDLVFGPRRKVVFVHGCFWHGHGCSKGQLPRSKLDYWGPKVDGNKQRDERNRVDLEALGWDVLTVWQCETRDVETLTRTLTGFLEKDFRA